MTKLIILLGIYGAVFATGSGASDSSVDSLIRKWAPRVWIHSKDQFMPYNISDYLTQVTPTLVNCSTPANCSYPSSYLPVGTDSYGYYLVTNEDRDELLSNTSSFLYGTSPAVKNSTLHAFVDTCDTEGTHFVVTYWFFYSFDYGKQIVDLGILAKLPIFNEINKYLGIGIESHVADLERMALEIKDGVPVSLFLSVHSIGVYYDYDTTSGTFKLSYSKSKGPLKVMHPPKTVELVDGHPVIYSALGSHGVWASSGTHMYSKFGELLYFLSDEVNQGTAWDTWQALDIHHVNATSTLPSWYEYLGDWGNPGGDCLTFPVIDATVCHFVDGPSPLATRPPDFYCTD